MPYSLRGVAASDIGRIWPQVSPLLAGALARNARGVTLQFVRETLADGGAALWLVVDDAVPQQITAVLVWYPEPRRQALCVWLMGGENMREWLDTAIDALTFHVEQLGYSALEASVRPGLAKILKGKGWQVEHITVRNACNGRIDRQGRTEVAHSHQRGNAAAVAD